MKVACVGNIAGNAYSLAKGLRALGLEADSFDQGSGWVFSLPIWDEGDFDLKAQGYDAAYEVWRASKLKTENGWRRPPWAKLLGNDGKDVKPWYDTQEDYEAALPEIQLGRHVPRPPVMQRYELRAALEASRLPEYLWDEATEFHMGSRDWRAQRDIIVQGGYDLAVLCGPYASVGPLLPREVPYVTLEHATMRDVPQLRTIGQGMLACAYQFADHNVITNADCHEAAGMIGVRRKSSFIPHPLDETKFTPDTTGQSNATREALREWLKCDLLFLAPARHSSNDAIGAKRNDRIIYAFHRYVREAEPAGAPKAGLVFFEWGNATDLNAARGLLASLGLSERVHWQAPQPRPRLAQLYRAADLVLDQFSEVGSFGTTTAEAMSCGKPVITHYLEDAHRWCLDVLGEHPPVLGARTVDDIYERLVFQATHPASRESVGQRGRAWVEKFHSLDRVSRMHLDLYTRVLAQKAVKRTPTTLAISEVRNSVAVLSA